MPLGDQPADVRVPRTVITRLCASKCVSVRGTADSTKFGESAQLEQDAGRATTECEDINAIERHAENIRPVKVSWTGQSKRPACHFVLGDEHKRVWAPSR